ncbi:MAG: YraN family protein [Gemmatimonadales bacterium]
MPNPRGPRPWLEPEATASSTSSSSKPLPEAARLAWRGENIAAGYLESRGFEILARNWRTGRRELDIVALDGRVVAFVEVKTRSGGPQHPLEAITRAKRREVRRAAAAWIREHPGLGEEFRFDAVAVRFEEGSQPTVDHVRNAFFGEDT